MLRRGTGEPVTLYAHGFGGSITDTRPFARGIDGSSAFLHFRGHGGRPSPGPRWDYAGLAAELDEALIRAGATRALGVSMGAGALARLLAGRAPAMPSRAAEAPSGPAAANPPGAGELAGAPPDGAASASKDGAGRLQKAALVLPAVLDRPSEAARRRGDVLRAAVERGDAPGLAELLLEQEPEEVRANPQARAWIEARASALVGTDQRDGLSLLQEAALPDREALRAVDIPVLVLTHEDDPAHPVDVARAYAEAIPGAELHILPPGSILWLGRDRIRDILTGFFND
nr:alpha/beta hydrolase [Sediminivirga luteola]